ncbi:hypothetical protein L917_18422 [Phytophthora nicotianae]|uniref:Uncharacterized protein n=1 Tax=Phytophthora nicotianae TaxID=4792 RepID=W2K9H9_PHYNI|nr:hypothetical protein L917_18422 [Phytophthora nicotianae]
MPSEPKHGLATRTRVLGALKSGRDWMLVADSNDIVLTASRKIIDRGPTDVQTRGSARAACTKCTPEIEDALVAYREKNCLFTLKQVQNMLRFGFGVRVSTSLTSKQTVQ